MIGRLARWLRVWPDKPPPPRMSAAEVLAIADRSNPDKTRAGMATVDLEGGRLVWTTSTSACGSGTWIRINDATGEVLGIHEHHGR